MNKYAVLIIAGFFLILLVPKSTINIEEGVLYGNEITATGMFPRITVTNYSLIPQTVDLEIKNFHKNVRFKVNPFEKKTMEVNSEMVDTYTFIFFGDNQPESGEEQPQIFKDIIKKINNEDPLFIVGGGDFVCEASDANFKEFLNVIADLQPPIFFVCGNHDIMDNKTLYAKYLGSNYYSFVYGTSLFIFLDDSTGFLDETQLSFLESELKRDVKNKFIFMHIPPFDPRPGGNHCMIYPERIMEIIEENNVDYVFCSHIHSYYEEKRGDTVYIISGGAGAPLLRDGFYHYIVVNVSENISFSVARFEDE